MLYSIMNFLVKAEKLGFYVYDRACASRKNAFQQLEYYFGGFCSFGPKKRQKNMSSVVSSGHFWEVCWGSQGSIPGLANFTF